MGLSSSVTGITAGILQSLIGGISARKNRKKQEKLIDQQLDENQELFNKQYYQNILDRSDTANLLQNYRRTLDQRNQARQNMAAVTGATPEALAAQKKSDAEAYSNAISNIAAQSSQIKDKALQQYQYTRNNLLSQKGDIYAQLAQRRANIAAQGGDLTIQSHQELGNTVDNILQKIFGNLFANGLQS